MTTKAYTLVGVNGNAFSIMGYTTRAMKDAGFTQEQIEAYKKEAMSGDYNQLLSLSVDKINECNEILGLEEEDEEWDEDSDADYMSGIYESDCESDWDED